MQGHLSLIKTGTKDLEKRVFPRFPFSYLLFKTDDASCPTFEVKDISYSGMQICLKNGGHTIRSGESIKGNLNWRGQDLKINGKVMWVNERRVGVEFNDAKGFGDDVREYLSIKNIVSGMRPLHDKEGLGLDLPSDLGCWLQADGPVEVFVWHHADGDIARFQIILMDSFLEYKDGKGLQSGRILTKRDLETPLVNEDEFVFEMDSTLCVNRLATAKELIEHIPDHYFNGDTQSFLKTKLGINS